MKHIPLINSTRTVTVDDEDFEYLSQWDWFLTSEGYAGRLEPSAPDTVVFMHDEVVRRASREGER